MFLFLLLLLLLFDMLGTMASAIMTDSPYLSWPFLPRHVVRFRLAPAAVLPLPSPHTTSSAWRKQACVGGLHKNKLRPPLNRWFCGDPCCGVPQIPRPPRACFFGRLPLLESLLVYAFMWLPRHVRNGCRVGKRQNGSFSAVHRVSSCSESFAPCGSMRAAKHAAKRAAKRAAKHAAKRAAKHAAKPAAKHAVTQHSNKAGVVIVGTGPQLRHTRAWLGWLSQAADRLSKGPIVTVHPTKAR